MTTAPTELKPSAPAVGGVRVKPLDWLNNELNDATRARDYIIISGVKHFRLYRRVHNINGQESLGAFDTMAEAKVAAQAHHEAAILSALEPQAVDDAMVERMRTAEARVKEMVDALELVDAEAAFANNVISHNRDGAGQGRVKVATSLHRIEQFTRAALQAAKGGE